MFGVNPDLTAMRRSFERTLRRLVAQRPRPLLVVYTSIVGGRHRLIDPTVLTPDCRYVCFTDQPFQSEVWEIVRVPSSDNPRKASRYYKMKPHLLFDVEYSLWIDAGCRVNIDVRRLIRRYMTRGSIATFAHPDMDCVYELAERHIARKVGGDPAVIRSQMARFRSEGLPARAGIWNCSALLRRHTPEIRALNDAWWRELEGGVDFDEPSFGFLTWRLGIPVATMHGNWRENAELERWDIRRERFASEFDHAEWSRLVPPRSVAIFPADIANTALEYRGIYNDGWLDDAVFVGLEHPEGPAHLVVRGMVPLVDDPTFTTEMQVLVDGREIARVTLGPGDFTLIEPVQPGAGRRCVWLHFSNGQVLADEQFPRRVTALARFIGFEADVGDGQRPHVCQAAREAVEEPDAMSSISTDDEKPAIGSASFPADLGNAALEYDGIFLDGWLMGTASLCLDQAEASSVLMVRMLIPLIDDPGFTTELCLLVDGTEILRQAFGIGEFELRVTVPRASGLRRVEFRFSSTQWLPEAVPRRVTALALFVGFED